MTKMTRDDFAELLDIYSADFSFWPAELIKPALAMIEQDAKCKEMFEQALVLDDRLRKADADVVAKADRRLDDGAALMARIMAEIGGPQTPMPVQVPVKATTGWRAFFAPSGGLLAVAVLGFMIGLQQPALSDDGADAIVGGTDIVIAADGGDVSREVY